MVIGPLIWSGCKKSSPPDRSLSRSDQPVVEDPEKAASAAVFHERYKAARKHPEYLRLLAEHRAKYERA